MSDFPLIRPRRLRYLPQLREMLSETQLQVSDLIMPLFLKNGKNLKESIASMPGMFRFSPDLAVQEVQELAKLGIKSILLFGIADHKDSVASEAYSENAAVIQGLKILKQKFPGMVMMADVCLCEYTTHGHCGVLTEGDPPQIDNDRSLEILSKISAAYARAGADVIAPSDMMDGRVEVIRDELDACGFKHLPILSYAAKYASAFYGPFRDAVGSAPQFGDRKSYQMNPANIREAMLEVEQDIRQGADMVMVKPAMPYLDVIAAVRQRFDVPVVAYQVSGEYSMIQLGIEQKLFDSKAIILESLTSIKRAGANLIITYFAKQAATLIN